MLNLGKKFKVLNFINKTKSPFSWILSTRESFHSANITIGIKAYFDSNSKISKMVGQNQTFAEGASSNRLLLFAGVNDPFWKVRMQIFLEYVDRVFGML